MSLFATCACRHPWRPVESVRSPEARVTGDCVFGTKPGSSARAVITFNCGATSLCPYTCDFYLFINSQEPEKQLVLEAYSAVEITVCLAKSRGEKQC